MRDKIFCFGRPTLDITVCIKNGEFKKYQEIPEILRESEIEHLFQKISKNSNSISVSAGGVETNVAINSAILGLPSVLVGRVGNDQLYKILSEYSEQTRGRLELSLQVDGRHASSTIIVIKSNRTQEKVKTLNYGASDFLEWYKWFNLKLESSTIFFSSLFSVNSIPLKEAWWQSLKLAKELRKKIVINLGGISTISQGERQEIVRFINKYGDIILMNEKEQEVLKSSYGIKETEQIRTVFSKPSIVIVTRASSGAVILTRDKKIIIKPKEFTTGSQIFPMGAGDAFTAGFLYSRSIGNNVVKAANFASEISFLQITHRGSHLLPGMFSKKEGNRW